MRYVYLCGWAITRFQFIVLWSFAQPIGEAADWFRAKYVQGR